MSTSRWDTGQVLKASARILEFLSAAESPLRLQDLYASLVQEDGLLALDENLAYCIAISLSDYRAILMQVEK